MLAEGLCGLRRCLWGLAQKPGGKGASGNLAKSRVYEVAVYDIGSMLFFSIRAILEVNKELSILRLLLVTFDTII